MAEGTLYATEANGVETARVVRGIKRSVLNGLAGVGAVVAVITVLPFDEWVATRLAGPWEDPTGNVLIVLAGSMQPDGILGQSSYLRSQYAVRAYREGGFRIVVLSGGGSPPAAVAMQHFLEAHGVPASAIALETRATTTRESALYTKPLLGRLPGPHVLMTSDYHMFRAHRVFTKVGIEVRPRPIPDARKFGRSWTGRWPVFLELARETVKIAYYYVRGWM